MNLQYAGSYWKYCRKNKGRCQEKTAYLMCVDVGKYDTIDDSFSLCVKKREGLPMYDFVQHTLLGVILVLTLVFTGLLVLGAFLIYQE